MIIAKNVNLSPGQLCTVSLGNPCNEPIDPKLNWTLPLPPKPPTKKQTKKLSPLKKERKTFKFLQISDTHVDLNYTIGTNAACNEPLCCRDRTNDLYSRSMDLDIRRKAKLFNIKLNYRDETKAGKWGSYGKC